MADIFHFEPPAQSKTHQFIVQFVLILRMHALALYRQQIIQYGKIFILVDFIQVTVKYALGNFLQLKRLPYLYLPPFGKAVLIMIEGTAKALLINIFLLFQTVDYAVYGIIGNTPTLQLLRNFRTAMLRSGAISSHAA